MISLALLFVKFLSVNQIILFEKMLEFEENHPFEFENVENFSDNEVPEQFSDISSSDEVESDEEIPQDEPENSPSIVQLYNQGHEVLDGIFVRGYQAGYTAAYNQAIQIGISRGYSLGYQAGSTAQQMFYHQQHLEAQEIVSQRLAEERAENQRIQQIQEELSRENEAQILQEEARSNEFIILTDEEKNILSEIFGWN